MGLTYYAKKGKKRCEPFDVNSWGADLLGWLHESLGLPVSESDPGWKVFGRGEPFRVPWKATAAECRLWSSLLTNIPDEKFRELLKKRESAGWGGSEDEWVEWCRSWEKFLGKCSGYSAI